MSYLPPAVLVVEDNPLTLEIVARLLHTHGYNVLKAPNAAQAIEMICHYPGTIDLLLTDIYMPGIDGCELGDVAQALRPGLRVLYTSAEPDRSLVTDAIINRGKNFIAKTGQPDLLLEKVEHLLAA